MSKTNCINCGAAKDMSDIKCPFCGTSYVDLTALDLDKHEKVALVFKAPGGKYTVSMLARPRLESIDVQYHSQNIYADKGAFIAKFQDYATADVAITFQSVHQENNVLYKVQYNEVST